MIIISDVILSQTITIDPIDDQFIDNSSFEIIASTTSGLVLSYEVSGPASVSGNVITLDGTEGTVTVTVSQAGSGDYEASSETLSFEVTDPCKTFSVVISQESDVSCNGGSDGSIGISVSGGTKPYAFSMDNGTNYQPDSVFTGLMTDEYIIHVKDDNECTSTLNVNIEEPAEIVLTAEIENTAGTEEIGSIDVTASGGTGSYTFEWGNGETTSLIDELSGGNYQVTVTDENGCSVTEIFTVETITSIGDNTTEDFSFYPNPTHDFVIIRHPESLNEVSLYNALGELYLFQKTIGSEAKLDLSDFPAGIYFIYPEGASVPYRIVKQ